MAESCDHRKQLESILSASELDVARGALLFRGFVVEVFSHAGFKVTILPFPAPWIRYDQLPGCGLDLAVSSADSELLLGGPILVRVKYAELLFPQATQETQRLAHFIKDGWGVAGLLVNLGQNRSAGFVLAETPSILGITPQRLIGLLKDDALIELLRWPETGYPPNNTSGIAMSSGRGAHSVV